ncbi:MAG: radical SAM protein [Deltaproteobacteria bacterium]|nr:radical SAM protein [Deltaproteobacteria bacterium]
MKLLRKNALPLEEGTKPPRKTNAKGTKLKHAILINVGYPTPINKRGIYDVPELHIAAITLPLLASLIRDIRSDCTVRIYDELGTHIDMDYIDNLPRSNTIIFISVKTPLAYDAKHLFKVFNELKFTVVMGGPHVSSCLNEVIHYTNVAVHGEAEVHMENVIKSFESGLFDYNTLPGLQFKSKKNSNFLQSPLPDRHLYKHSMKYMFPGVIEFSRGCQYRCSFCASTNLYTDKVIHKSIDQVLLEIKTLPKFYRKFQTWFFVDDNFCSSHRKTKDLSLAIGRNFPEARWGCAMTIMSARDTELLDAMVAGGMRYVFIGFDSIVQSSLEHTRKSGSKTREYSILINELKKRNVFIIAAIVFGFDQDNSDIFKNTLEWAKNSGVDALNLNVLRPYPNTPLYNDLKQQNRLIFDPWWQQPLETRMEMVQNNTYNLAGTMVTYKPKNMSAKELTHGTLWVGQEFYKPTIAIPRIIKNYSQITNFTIEAIMNYGYHNEYKSINELDIT